MKMKPTSATADMYQLPAMARAAVRKMGTDIQAVEFLASFKLHLL
jgi:hypothetical protein